MKGFNAARFKIGQFDFSHERRRNAVAVVGVTRVNEGSHLREGVKASRADEDVDLCQAGLLASDVFRFLEQTLILVFPEHPQKPNATRSARPDQHVVQIAFPNFPDRFFKYLGVETLDGGIHPTDPKPDSTVLG